MRQREKKRYFTFTRINNCANYWLIVDCNNFSKNTIFYFYYFCEFKVVRLPLVPDCVTVFIFWLKSFFLFFLHHLNYFLMMIYYKFFIFKFLSGSLFLHLNIIFNLFICHPSIGYEGLIDILNCDFIRASFAVN